MKKSLYTLAFILMLTACKWQRLGDMTMISNRNLANLSEDVELKRYVEMKVKTSKGDALEHAVDEAVKTVPNGEYLKNVKIYLSGSGKKLKIEGDVWGKE